MQRGTPTAKMDSIDALLADWAVQRPDLDFVPVGIFTRLTRVRMHLTAGLERVFLGYDLTAADFAVIAALRRAGAPYRMVQADLMSALRLTSGTISVRLRRLVDKGIVVREAGLADRRTQHVALTDAGLELFAHIAPVHLANEDRLLSALDPTQRAQLTELLRILLVSFERTGPNAFCWRGLRLEPAHLARTRRVEVGLGDEPGLLVAGITDRSQAQRRELRPGDLLTAVDGHALLSITQLAAVPPAKPARISALRGTQRIESTIPAEERVP